MFKRSLFTLAASALLAASLQAQTADEILAKNAEAKGGLEKMKAVKSRRLTGKMTIGPGMEAPFTLVQKRPEMIRFDFTIQGMTGTQAYDGSTGWMVMPFLGKKDAETMSPDALKVIQEQADFDGSLIDYKEKGNKVELLGKEDIQGTPAYKVKVVTKAGVETVYFIDADSFLEIASHAKRTMQGQEIESETTFGNYKAVDGIMIPFSVEMKQKGAPVSQTMTLEKVENNPALDDATFAMPKKEAAPAAKSEGAAKQ